MSRAAMALLACCAPALSTLVSFLPAQPAQARQDADTPEARYRNCMEQVESDPQQAFETAQNWKKKGGGEPAGHCQAAAAFALGRFIDAAEDLEALARGPHPTSTTASTSGKAVEDTRSSQLLHASLWAQAAHAWLSADRPEEAEHAASEAAKLQPRDPAPLVLRARALAAQRRWTETVADLDRAINLDPKFVDAYVFRASALRQLRAFERAGTDLDTALTLDPQQPEALLERGILRRLQGDDAGARADWTALTSTAPKTPAAEEARLNLEKMDKGE